MNNTGKRILPIETHHSQFLEQIRALKAAIGLISGHIRATRGHGEANIAGWPTDKAPLAPNLALVGHKWPLSAPLADAEFDKVNKALMRDRIYLNLLEIEIDAIENDYNLSIVSILVDYATMDEIRENLISEYYRRVSSENFSSKLANIARMVIQATDIVLSVRIAKKMANKRPDVSKKDLDLDHEDPAPAPIWERMSLLRKGDPLYPKMMELRQLFNIFDNYMAQSRPSWEQKNYNICDSCGHEMQIEPNSVRFECNNCNSLKKLEGVVIDESGVGITANKDEGSIITRSASKYTNFDHNRHFKFWMEHIQALEKKMILQSDLDVILYALNRDKRKYVDVIIMRRILKETKMTKYNNNVALLIKLTTGRAPPQLNYEQLARFQIKFNKIMEILFEIDGATHNRPYYPYFIYKIAEQEFKGDPNMLQLLTFIHLQSDQTLLKNDMKYKEICERSGLEDGLVPSLTERYKL
jgi:Poxvirus Late Transcription Factor VLTF3 like